MKFITLSYLTLDDQFLKTKSSKGILIDVA